MITKQHVDGLLKKDKRLDGRGLDDFRKVVRGFINVIKIYHDSVISG